LRAFLSADGQTLLRFVGKIVVIRIAPCALLLHRIETGF